MKKPVIVSILLIGATAIIAQIVLIRELIVVFYGNEISVGFVLAGWLFLGAIGSLFLGRIADRIKARIEIFGACQLFLSAVLPLSLLLIRFIKKVLGVMPGEIISFGAMISSSFVILAPLCIILGFLFALSCRVYRLNDSATGIGRVYILESIGAALGGIFCSFLLIKYLSSIEILVGLSISNAAACLFLTKNCFRSGAKALFRTAVALWLIAVLTLVITGAFQQFDRKLLEMEWRPLELVSTKNSIYGNIAITKKGSQVSFFSNGLHNFSVPDELAQEEAVHFALLEHPQPEEVLLIGGGMGGLVWEILKHPVKRVDYVELDPLIIKLGNLYLKDAEYFVGKNPRVNIVNTDGRFWVKKGRGEYDVIIINVPNPFTAQLNRFYTLEFFQELRRIMKQPAVLSFSVTSSENYISRELGRFLGSLNNTLNQVFPDVKVIPGDTANFTASNEKGLLSLNYKFLVNRLKERGIETRFVREYYLFSKLSPDRLGYINKTLGENRLSEINRDFRPISYYYDMLLWSTHFKGSSKKVSSFLTEPKIWSAFGLIYIVLIVVYPLVKKRLKPTAHPVIIAIGTTGFSEIAFELCVVLAFQIIYGFLYYKIGLIITSFMAGLALGSFYITSRLHRLKDDLDVFIKMQLGIVIYPLILPPIFLFLAGHPNSLLAWLGSNIIFPLLPVIAGFLGGLQFPLGAKIYLANSKNVAKAGGLAYGIDLIGACIGAIVISTILIPLLGVFKTCLAVSLLNLSVLVLLLMAKGESAPGHA